MSKIFEHIKTLDRKINVQDGVIAQLKDNNAALQVDNAAFKVENAALKVRVGIFEEDNQDLREAIDGVSTFACLVVTWLIISLQHWTAALRKLRRRILLDQARKKILSKWAPYNPRTTWTNLCDTMSQSDLRHFISSRNVFSRALLDDTFTMVYDGRGTVRQDGNEVAHEADKDLVKDEVVHADPGDLKALKNVYGCVFDEDLQ
jgi:hypothetical protein